MPCEKTKKSMTSENVEWGQISQFKKERDNNCSLIASAFGLTIDKQISIWTYTTFMWFKSKHMLKIYIGFGQKYVQN